MSEEKLRAKAREIRETVLTQDPASDRLWQAGKFIEAEILAALREVRRETVDDCANIL